MQFRIIKYQVIQILNIYKLLTLEKAMFLLVIQHVFNYFSVLQGAHSIFYHLPVECTRINLRHTLKAHL